MYHQHNNKNKYTLLIELTAIIEIWFCFKYGHVLTFTLVRLMLYFVCWIIVQHIYCVQTDIHRFQSNKYRMNMLDATIGFGNISLIFMCCLAANIGPVNSVY